MVSVYIVVVSLGYRLPIKYLLSICKENESLDGHLSNIYQFNKHTRNELGNCGNW
jgi:hypothetical protein